MRKLKSFNTQVPKVRRPKPATNIIKADNLYLVASDHLLSKMVSDAKELVVETGVAVVFFLDENIFNYSSLSKLMEISMDREEWKSFYV